MNVTSYISSSFAVALAVIVHAFYTREQFYPSVLYLTTSKLCLVSLANGLFAGLVCIYSLVVTMFFGKLSNGEQERLMEKAKDAIMETCLAMTIFRQEFNSSFLLLFTLLLFLKVFHWIAMDRVEYAETTADVSIMGHLKVAVLMFILLFGDAMFLVYSLRTTIETGPSVILLFAFEYVILATITISGLCRYCFYYIDYSMARRNNAMQRERADGTDTSEDDDDLGLGAGEGLGVGAGGGNGWEHKGIAVFYLGIVTDMVQLLVYFVFFIVILSHYGMPLHLIRDLYMTLRNFRNRVGDFIRYRRITRNMHKKFKNATKEDVEREPTCIVCREQMVVSDDGEGDGDSENNNDSVGSRRHMQRNCPKVLPCGHTFHLGCLRSWLERQQSCPTCRAAVNLTNNVAASAGRNDGDREQRANARADDAVQVQQNDQENQPQQQPQEQQQQQQVQQQQQQQQQQPPLYRRFQYNFGFNFQVGNNQARPTPQNAQAPQANREPLANSNRAAANESAQPSTSSRSTFSPQPYPMMMPPYPYPPFAIPQQQQQQQQQQEQQQQFYQSLLDNNLVLKSLSESRELMDSNNIPQQQQQMIVSAAAAASAAAAKTAAALLPIVTLPDMVKYPNSESRDGGVAMDDSEVKVPRNAADLADLFRKYRGVVDVANTYLKESSKEEQERVRSS